MFRLCSQLTVSSVIYLYDWRLIAEWKTWVDQTERGDRQTLSTYQVNCSELTTRDIHESKNKVESKMLNMISIKNVIKEYSLENPIFETPLLRKFCFDNLLLLCRMSLKTLWGRCYSSSALKPHFPFCQPNDTKSVSASSHCPSLPQPNGRRG